MDNYINNIANQTLIQAQSASINPVGAGKSAQTPEQITKTAKEFEVMFLSQMLNHMFKDVAADPLFGDQASDEIYRSMLLNEYGKSMAESHSLGIADHVQAELLKLQEIQQ